MILRYASSDQKSFHIQCLTKSTTPAIPCSQSLQEHGTFQRIGPHYRRSYSKMLGVADYEEPLFCGIERYSNRIQQANSRGDNCSSPLWKGVLNFGLIIERTWLPRPRTAGLYFLLPSACFLPNCAHLRRLELQI
jgi:hypothetical protein